MKKLLLVVATVLGLGVVGLVGTYIYAMTSVETPSYEVVKSDGAFEVRAYPALTVAEITAPGLRGEAVSNSFRPLASYIFAKERGGEKISMTAPVTQRKAEDRWAVQFIMPAGYSLDTLPKPDNAEIALRELPPQQRIAIRFSGRQTDELLAQKETDLREWAVEQGIKINPVPTYAYYNDPFTPGFLRRNEVLFDVE